MKNMLPHLFLSVWFIFSSLAGESSISSPKVKWKYKSGASIRGSVAADRNAVYFGNSEGSFYSLNKTDASVRWTFKCNGAVNSTPVLAGEMIFVTARGNTVYGLNASSGKLVWKNQMGSETPHKYGWDYFIASPVVSGKNVIVGSGDNSIYAFNMSDGKLVWKFTTGNKIRATPLLSDGILYAPSFDGVVYVLEAGSGKLLWKFETEGSRLNSEEFGWDRNSINSTPALADSLLVFGSRDGNVYCVNIETHRKKWSFSYGPTWAIASPTIGDGVVYIGWSDNLIFSAIDLFTGKEKWKYDCGSLVYSNALIDGESVNVASTNGKLYSFNKSTGVLEWEYATDRSIFSSPISDASLLYVGNDEGCLYAFEKKSNLFKAVFLPDHLDSRFVERGSVDKGVAPFLIEKGYERLDSAKLFDFLTKRIADHAPSVVVFAHETFPKNIIGEDAAQGLMRKYMESGGKIVWPGQLPSKQFAVDLLGLEIDMRHETGNYFATSTKAGLDWGLPKNFNATNSQISPKGIVPLAINELGRVAAWHRHFGNSPYSGLIFCRTWGRDVSISQSDLYVIQKIAEYGLD